MSARDAILGRLRQATAASAVREVPAQYRRAADMTQAERLDRLISRLHDYGVTVLEVDREDQIAAVATERVAARNLGSLLIPAGLPSAWRPNSASIIEDAGQGPHDLARIDAVMTGCAVAIAETGSIVLDAGATQGRRTASLVPDYCLCVVLADQVVGLVPEAIARLAEAARNRRPITFISGPSATADIELKRVAGVHGPRHLDVVLVGDRSSAVTHP